MNTRVELRAARIAQLTNVSEGAVLGPLTTARNRNDSAVRPASGGLNPPFADGRQGSAVTLPASLAPLRFRWLATAVASPRPLHAAVKCPWAARKRGTGAGFERAGGLASYADGRRTNRAGPRSGR